MMCELIPIDHGEYQKKVKTMSQAALTYTIKDAREAIIANPEGPKAGYYQDEIHYCLMEMKRRKDEQGK